MSINTQHKPFQTQLKYHHHPNQKKCPTLTNSLYISDINNQSHPSSNLSSLPHTNHHLQPNSSQTKLNNVTESHLRNRYKNHKTHSTYSLRSKYPQYQDDELCTNKKINTSVIIKGSDQQNPSSNFIEEFIMTKREMYEYNKRVKLINTRINTLKRQDDNWNNKMITMQRREAEIEEIKEAKRKFKAKLQYAKDLKAKEAESRKEELKQKKLSAKEKSSMIIKAQNEKRQSDFESIKEQSTVVKAMISQSTQKTRTLNKYKYLQVKEGHMQYHTNEEMSTMERQEQLREDYQRKIKENMNNISALKTQYNELERIEGDYIDKIRNTKKMTMKFNRHLSPHPTSIVKDDDDIDEEDEESCEKSSKKKHKIKKRHNSVNNGYKTMNIPMHMTQGNSSLNKPMLHNEISPYKSKASLSNLPTHQEIRIKPLNLPSSLPSNDCSNSLRNSHTTRSNYSSNYTNSNNNGLCGNNNNNTNSTSGNHIRKKSIKEKQKEYNDILTARTLGNMTSSKTKGKKNKKKTNEG